MLRRKLTLIAASFSLLALAGCNPDLKTVCPAIKVYSMAEIQAVAKQYPSLPQKVRDWLSDYRLLRRQCAAISK